MGLIIFVLCVPVLAVAVATYVFLREPLPPFHVTSLAEVDESWPFPREPKP